MVLYDSTGKTGLVDDFFFLIFGNSDDHTSDVPLADIVRMINRGYDETTIKILQADSQWEWDDNNKADLPISRIDLVAGQQNYGISGAVYLKVGKVEIQDPNGNWIRLRQFQEDELGTIADNAFDNTPGVPQFYRIQGNSIFLYATPNYSLVRGIRIFYQRNVTYFTAGNTTPENAQVPGFAEPFHRILSVVAALDYAMTSGMSGKVTQLTQRKTLMLQDLEIHYSTRNDNKVSLKLHKDDYGETTLGMDQGGVSNNDYRPYGFF